MSSPHLWQIQVGDIQPCEVQVCEIQSGENRGTA